jgi:hypothetical protein
VPLTGTLQVFVTALMSVLDCRIAFRLAIIMSGMVFADDRRTASSWFAAAGVLDDWDRFYDVLTSIGMVSESLGTAVLKLVVRKLDPGPQGRVVFGIDDTPTRRYGQHVEGAGVHHHPTPGPADGEWLYGHNWVSLCWLATHSLWGAIALPLRSLLYVRQDDVAKLDPKYNWKFRTKHELGTELVSWFVKSVRSLGVRATLWLVVDGGYTARKFLLPALELGVIVVGRLRKDAVLFNEPSGSRKVRRGRPPIYGQKRIRLRQIAEQSSGWETLTYNCRGQQVTRQYKTFVATSQLVSGTIRVVILRYEDGSWAPYFCTCSTAEVKDILEVVAARWAMEEHFRDVKEVWGAGQQQVRNLWSNIGCWHLNQWMYTLVELSCWDRPKSELTDRSDRSWDNADRRPSHADRRRAISREMLRKEFLAGLPPTPEGRKFRKAAEALFSLCT